ncbi:MAG: lecithin retinol acyltransferase family protein [Pleurocapsa minor HA4230-MV1]|jgi:hypothetical protein|nr:lecithin retinol acyltransferase family protein [Pleurocapsa minor HA4230-MV1]
MTKGDHIYVHAGLITHHGINCGDGTVIHYRGKQEGGKITKTSYREFAQGKQVYVKSYSYKYSPDAIVRRAERRLHEPNYRLFFNNCEHFATCCTSGEPDSQQVRNAGAACNAGFVAGAGLALVETTVPAAGILGTIGFTTTVGLPLAAVAVGAVAVGGAIFGIAKIFSESDDRKY